MKRRIEHARARCQKTSHKQKPERKETEKPQDKEPSKTCTNSR
ncbi:MAG TPA: hypothetical protein VGC66_22965 [Pyrinomonadaceae bacterium]